MNEGLIPRRYAKALLLVAAERGVAADVYEQMKCLEAGFVEMPALNDTLNNPYISEADKSKLILTACGVEEKNDKVIKDFVKLLQRNGRIGMMRLIAYAYVELYREENHIYSVIVKSAAQLSSADEKRLKGLVEKHLHGGKMEYTQIVDSSLIGGFTDRVGNEKIDASVSNELKQLRLNLLSK